ncbi:MAG: 50S ribosomal protein L4 [Gallionella sp.]|nr:50S ribosomal protein L4 [Gallionella sp.]OIO08887.1 MAG: 50S ribosomal protein L4 [Gallionellaceae bacterium CG1_02_60_325]PIR09391.1 MAG: 50S ribosomal protein L4 [Gallionellaceae bacterium CG11_big_fil_rev_8_21_14_0_20_60_62]PIV48286.1 MAG: 50S ribosomal protein L4 [Gallionellaceae bacterium CG02_land_8_20_14_3_00_60_115]PIY05690.1 MAG: 50S ribosomal protein L4 [Gallionellaceae bacterium CG_4_10_14_3_um_filter_60_1069]PJC04637.1 MAG: 50S ribosomal protein L4 [Gallionellaceae bacterium CG
MELKLINENGKPGASVSASDDLFGREYNEALVHQLVTAYLANARSANSKQKGRSEIAKSTRKPFAQKGTGRARAGMASSPLWRGGGKIFPNSPDQNYSQKINRKMYRAGLASIFSKLVRDGRLSVIEGLTLEAPKTKLLADKIKAMGLQDARLLIITDSIDENLYLSARNLPNVLVVEAHQADPVSLVRFSNVLVTRNAIAKIEELLA